MQENISLACSECKRKNYTTTKNKKTNTEKLELSQVLPFLPEAHRAQGRRKSQGCSSNW